MFMKYSRDLLVILFCACLCCAVAVGVEGSISELVEATTCDIRRSFETEIPADCIETKNCEWKACKQRDRSGVRPFEERASQPRPSEQRYRNGFGGPLCC